MTDHVLFFRLHIQRRGSHEMLVFDLDPRCLIPPRVVLPDWSVQVFRIDILLAGVCKPLYGSQHRICIVKSERACFAYRCERTARPYL